MLNISVPYLFSKFSPCTHLRSIVGRAPFAVAAIIFFRFSFRLLRIEKIIIIHTHTHTNLFDIVKLIISTRIITCTPHKCNFIDNGNTIRKCFNLIKSQFIYISTTLTIVSLIGFVLFSLTQKNTHKLNNILRKHEN